MIRWLTWCLLLAGGTAQAATLWWVTSDITPVARTAMVARQARAAGFDVVHTEYPLRGAATLAPSERDAARRHRDAASMVWIDAAHPLAAARLAALLADELPAGPRVVWVEPSARAAGMAGYLLADGEHNITQAVALAAGRPVAAEPMASWPTKGLYHPDAPGPFADAASWRAWRGDDDRPLVAVLVHRANFVHGGSAWLDRWLRQFEAAGLQAVAVFCPQTDLDGLTGLLEHDGRPIMSVVVTHQLLSRAPAWQARFVQWDVPVLSTLPYRRGDESAWAADVSGLALADVPPYLVWPEAAGAVDPMVVVAMADGGRHTRLIDRQALAVVAKARRLVQLRQRPAADKRLVVMVYPETTSFLDVPRSLARVTEGLADGGFDVTPVTAARWDAALASLAADSPSAWLARGDAETMPLAVYLRWWDTLPAPVRSRIEARWGPPAGSGFVIPRVRVGKLSVLLQPAREEGPRSHQPLVPPSHHYLATYLWARETADALVHFGTHGTQEWSAGKARGLDVWDDALLPLGDLPVIYPYIVDNVGEAMTAKRRGRALLISHRAPVLAVAGLDAPLAGLHDLMHQWSVAESGPLKSALQRQWVRAAVRQGLHDDLDWTRPRIDTDPVGFGAALHPHLDLLARAAQPQGLAVFGQVPEVGERRRQMMQMLRKPLAERFGAPWALERPEEAARWLDAAGRDADHPLAGEVRALDRLLATDHEMPALLHALGGGFIAAGPGGDPVRHPESLPTGRNLVGMDPARLPSPAAYDVAQRLFDRWLVEWRQSHRGAMPGRLALSLWAGETVRQQGVMEAQALVALGVRPVWDEGGRTTGVEVIPRQVLGRPRVDVLFSITGSYRDQFPALMALLDRAVAAAAQAEPDNVLVRHEQAVAEALGRAGVAPEDARTLARVRVFGNVPGDYGSGVDATGRRAGEAFLGRMSQPHAGGAALDAVPSEAGRQALAAHLVLTDAAMLSRSSHLYGVLTSDEPFQYLGGLAAAARSAGRVTPVGLYVSQLQDPDAAETLTAARAVAIEMRTRLLHPAWQAAQRRHGAAGAREVAKVIHALDGWRATAPDVVRHSPRRGTRAAPPPATPTATPSPLPSPAATTPPPRGILLRQVAEAATPPQPLASALALALMALLAAAGAAWQSRHPTGATVRLRRRT